MSADASRSFDPLATIVHLREDGRAMPVAWTPDVFRERLVGRATEDRVSG